MEAVGEKLGYSPSLIAAIETGTRNPQTDFVILAANLMVQTEPDRTPDINELLASAELPQIDQRLFPR